MNYLAIGEQIVERLKSQVPELLEVYTPAEVGDAEQSTQVTPCAHVVYGGDQIAATAGGGKANIIPQKWFVILAVNHASAQLGDTSAIRREAGEIIPKILAALNGFKPASSMRPLTRVDASAPVYESTFAYYPFAFEGQLITT